MHAALSPSAFSQLASQYLTAVEEYLAGATEWSLHRNAHTIGQSAVADGLGVIDLATIHQITLTVLMSNAGSTPAQARAARAASEFFSQSLRSFEQAPVL